MCNQWWMRLISFVVALVMSAIVFIFPQAIAKNIHQLDHGLLTLLLLAVCVCFVHGVGFVFKSTILNCSISPLITLPVLMAVAWGVWG